MRCGAGSTKTPAKPERSAITGDWSLRTRRPGIIHDSYVHWTGSWRKSRRKLAIAASGRFQRNELSRLYCRGAVGTFPPAQTTRSTNEAAMRYLVLSAIVSGWIGLGALVQAQTVDPQLMAPINKFMDTFNKGDAAGA